jgi:hypothetical protein
MIEAEAWNSKGTDVSGSKGNFDQAKAFGNLKMSFECEDLLASEA